MERHSQNRPVLRINRRKKNVTMVPIKLIYYLLFAETSLWKREFKVWGQLRQEL